MQQRHHGKRSPKPKPDPAVIERVGVVLDYIPFGNRKDPHKHHQREPVVQALGYRRFTLVDGIPLNFSDIDFLEKVSLLSEVIKTIIHVKDTRRSPWTTVWLACYRTRDSSTCFAITEISENDARLLEESWEPEKVSVARDFAVIEEVLRKNGMPEKAIRVPPTPITYNDLTPTARDNLRSAVELIIREREKEFVTFFNIAEPINVRLHAIELLPGIGKKTLRKLLQYRNSKPFTSFDEIHKVIKVDPVHAITEKIIEEIKGESTYYLFVRPPERDKPFLDYLGLIARMRR